MPIKLWDCYYASMETSVMKIRLLVIIHLIKKHLQNRKAFVMKVFFQLMKVLKLEKATM